MHFHSFENGIHSIFSIAGACLLLGCSPGDAIDSDTDPTQSVDEAISSFDKNDILTDSELADTLALSADAVDAFLQSPYGGQASCLARLTLNGLSVGSLVTETAKRYGLNPIFLLSHLQKESSLIGNTSSTCPSSLLKKAFGCGCPDGGSCSKKDAGFENQLDCAGKLTRSYLEDLEAQGETIAGVRIGTPKTMLDGIRVTPTNAATAILYTYTPWVGVRDAGGNEAPFGNYLFWKVWRQYTKKLDYTGPEPGKGGALCQTDADCNGGAPETGVVCSNTGATKGMCIEGCHSDRDCEAGSICDTAQPHWKCAPPLN